MNIRQQKYKKNRLMGMNMYNAAMAAGYSHNTARNIKRNLENIENQGIFDVLDRAGLTDKAMGEELKKLTLATKISINETNDDEENKVSIPIPDNKIRLKTWELIAKIKKHFSEKLLDFSRHEHHTVIWEINGSTHIQPSSKPRKSLDRQGSL